MNELTRPDGEGIALTVGHVSKTFGPTRALRDVSFSVRRGTIHGLLGGNGSGKSTLIKVLAGVYQADPGGSLEFADQTVPAHETTPELSRKCGLRFVHQNPGVFHELTVAENVAIGGADGFPTRQGHIDWRRLRRRTDDLLNRFGIAARPDDVLGDLRQADQTMIAIARALEDGADESAPSLLVLDEPTASLPEHEVGTVLSALQRYAGAGYAILYVSHRLEEVLTLVDSVTVLRNGEHVITRNAAGLEHAELVEHIVGRPLERLFAEASSPAVGDLVLEADGLAGGPLHDVSLDVRAGEIVGVAGLLGSGRTELLRMVFGAYPRAGGRMLLKGQAYNPESPRRAMRRGIAYIPEHRELDAAFPDLSVRENLSIGQVRRYWGGTGFRHKQERRDAEKSITDFGIVASGTQADLSSLSGGNQQKVILARWLRRDPRLLLLDEPTQGVDVGARADVYAAIRRAVTGGTGALLVSSDFEELAHASDRVVVLREGRITAEVFGEELTAHRLNELVLTERHQTT